MFDREGLIEACKIHKTVARVVIADVAGSAPREVGAAMLVWQGGQSGTIGGGTLEYDLAQSALSGTDRMTRHALGPDLGQCCGGAVHILTEIYDLRRAQSLADDYVARGTGKIPFQVQTLISSARNRGEVPQIQRVGTWLIEPVHKPQHDLWIWGAGHVGRAVVNTIAPLPDFKITWIDTKRDRYPYEIPERVATLPAQNPIDAIVYADKRSHHLIMTYSHTIDLALCHGLLSHGFATCGLIGSKTKWARFRKRLQALGHDKTRISDIMCPIGDPRLGKHPQMIAISVADRLIKTNLGIDTPVFHPQEASA
jgi:xanthine dehydrogenase accessory factor